MQSKTLIHVEDLTVAYSEQPVLWDVDLNIPENVRCAVVGPNGAGKSTLIKAIMGLIKPLSGYVSLWGESLKSVRKRIAYVPQASSVNWDFPTTVLDVVTMGRYPALGLFRKPGKKEKELALSALKALELTDFKDRQISQLSGGQKQRVFIARALCQNADLYIMDEPLAGVDETSEKIIIQKMVDFQNEGKTVIAVHHDLNTLKEYFDWLVIINKTIKADGAMQETLTQQNLALAYRMVI